MHATLPYLADTDFPAPSRGPLTTLQVNLGYRCNQSCSHCHVAAGPQRTEVMEADTAAEVLAFLDRSPVTTLDLTGGAPELNPHFRELVAGAHRHGVHVVDRCNLTVLEEPGQEDLAGFLADHGVEIVASLPCYLAENVAKQRGKGVFEPSIRALQRLNGLGYGVPGSGQLLNLVYNPAGPALPPDQEGLEATYRQRLWADHGVRFSHLLALANVPVNRFGSALISQGRFREYLDLLRSAHRAGNLVQVMCRNLISVDWRGRVYDCDFNQMLDLPPPWSGYGQAHLRDLDGTALEGWPVAVGEHCYACTAGQGSSCGGALD